MNSIGRQDARAGQNHAVAGDSGAALVILEKTDSGKGIAEEQPGLEAGLHLEPPLSTLPTQVDVCVPLPFFRVSDLIALEPGRVLASEWGSMEDLPLTCGQVQLVWAEFEVVDQKIAVRVTRLIEE